MRSLNCIVSGFTVSSSLSADDAAVGGFSVLTFGGGTSSLCAAGAASRSSSISSSSFFDVSRLVGVSVDCLRIELGGVLVE